MRQDTIIGLNGYASNLIKDAKKEDSGKSYFGMYDNEYSLNKYTLLNGEIYCEKSQCSPWSSGPVIFLSLIYPDGTDVKETLWSDEEIEDIL